MKKALPWLIIALIIIVVVFRDKIMAFFSKPSPPVNGTPCTDANGNAGTYTNGVCTATGGPGPGNGDGGNPTERNILGLGMVARYGRKFIKCYPKPAGTMCVRRRFEPALGWGYLYSQTATSCCYIF